MSHFNTYGKMAKANVDNIIQNGRYYAQKDDELKIPSDVFSKLPLKPDDTFLDVGCGMGLNLREALKYTKNCFACDHQNVVGRLQADKDFSDVTFYEGDFLNLDVEAKFTRILIYGVVPSLPDTKTIFSFIEKALSLMKEDGLLLVADFSNTDKKKRFLQSQKGKRFQEEWEKQIAKSDKDSDAHKFVSVEDQQAATITDDTMLAIIRAYRNKGYNTYLLNQPQNLPFGNTREDILIVGPEYVE